MVKKEVDIEEKLQAANELLFQKDAKIEEERQKATIKKVKLKKRYQGEIESLEDATYTMFEEGFDEAIA